MGGSLKNIFTPWSSKGFGSPFYGLDKVSKAFSGGSDQADNIASAPVPTPANPASPNSAAVMQAEHDFAQRNMLKKSVRKTIVAGDTGGYMPAGPGTAPGAETGYKARL